MICVCNCVITFTGTQNRFKISTNEAYIKQTWQFIHFISIHKTTMGYSGFLNRNIFVFVFFLSNNYVLASNPKLIAKIRKKSLPLCNFLHIVTYWFACRFCYAILSSFHCDQKISLKIQDFIALNIKYKRTYML